MKAVLSEQFPVRKFALLTESDPTSDQGRQVLKKGCGPDKWKIFHMKSAGQNAGLPT